jgi:hypothetical protein
VAGRWPGVGLVERRADWPLEERRPLAAWVTVLVDASTDAVVELENPGDTPEPDNGPAGLLLARATSWRAVSKSAAMNAHFAATEYAAAAAG